jgi:hypothetical protein
LLRWHMKQSGICEHAIEPCIRKIEFEKILLPNFASRIGARHLNKPRGTFQSDRNVAKRGKRLQVTARPTAKIKNREWRLGFDMTQQRVDVLTHIVGARTIAKIFSSLVVVLQRQGSDFFEIDRTRLRRADIGHDSA